MPRFSKRTRKATKPMRRKRMWKRKSFTRRNATKVKGERSVTSTATYKPLQKRAISWPTVDGDVPQRVRIKMKYVENNLARAPGIIYDSYSFRANSIYDPNYTGTGNQPSMYDAFSSLYDVYAVWAVKYNVRIVNTTAKDVVFGLLFAEDVEAIESADKIRRSSLVTCTATPAGTAGASVTLSAYAKMTDIIGRRALDATRQSGIAGNPADPVFFTIYSCADDNATNITYRFSLESIQYVEFRSPKLDRSID